MNFTIEEENLISVFTEDKRDTLISNIRAAIPHFEESEMAELAEGVIKKLEAMTDSDFSELEIYPV